MELIKSFRDLDDAAFSRLLQVFQPMRVDKCDRAKKKQSSTLHQLSSNGFKPHFKTKEF